jgi:hypothetical protein
MSRDQRRRGRIAIVAITGLAAVAVGSVALAGHLGSGVKSYTGCLSTGDGVIVKVKEGDSPKSACSGGQTQVHLSGGDITKVSVTGALQGGGDNGEVTISLKPEFTLPSGCATGRVAEWNGTAWSCGIDDDTTYTAGTGLDLSGGNAFSIEPGYRIPGKSCTTSGQFATGFDGDGDISCQEPSNAGVEVWYKTRAIAGTVVVLPKGEGVDLITMPLQAGTYLITAVATVGDRDGTALGDEEVSVRCNLRNGAFADLPVAAGFVEIGEEVFDDGPSGSIAIHGVLSLGTADTVRFTCFSRHGDSDPDQASDVTMTAVKVGTAHAS